MSVPDSGLMRHHRRLGEMGVFREIHWGEAEPVRVECRLIIYSYRLQLAVEPDPTIT